MHDLSLLRSSANEYFYERHKKEASRVYTSLARQLTHLPTWPTSNIRGLL